MENHAEIKIKLKDFDIDIELKPLTLIVGKNPVEKSLLLRHLWASVTDAVFLPANRTCVADGFINRPIRLTRSAELLLRDIGIELYVAPSAVYVKTSSGRKFELAYAPPAIRDIIAVLLALSSETRFIFIEEPEARLHPSAQRFMARIIAEAVNGGKFVVLTTHSDYIISEINNIIALSNAPADVKKKLGYRDAEVLKPEAVVAYLVRAGAVVERLEVDHTGIPEDEFARVAEEILRIRNELY
ncbi:MAG: AAA family ATPase [Pyrobaculum sp.]|jgi:predicted ATPase